MHSKYNQYSNLHRISHWFSRYIVDNILNPNFSSTGLNTSMIDNLITENKRAQFDHGTLIWRLLLFQKWINNLTS